VIRAAMRRRFWTWTVLACAAGLLVLRAAWTWLPPLLPPCLFRRWTGWSCPGCGGTRCVGRLLHGDLAGALAANPLVVLCGLFAAGWLAAAVAAEWRGRPVPALSARLVWALFGVAAVFALTRNLPWWPFTLLAPR